VRDLAKASGKEEKLVISGSQVKLDRSILAALKDPLLHLVRNAIDHAVETPDERKQDDAPPQGSARQRIETLLGKDRP